MHDSVLAFVDSVLEQTGTRGLATLEVGAADVNGSVRSCFHGDYCGLDVCVADGVDLVGDGEALPFADGSWPQVVSTEMLEHCRRPWRAVAEMARVLAPGGHCVVTARGFDEVRGCFGFHNPPDRWRFSAEGVALLFADAGLLGSVEADPQVPGWFAHAWKPEVT